MTHKEVSNVCDRIFDSMDRVKGVVRGSLSMTDEYSIMIIDILGYLDSFASVLESDMTTLKLIRKGEMK